MPGAAAGHADSNASTTASGPETFVLQTFVEMGDLLAVAVVQQRRAALAGADQFLGSLAPARMRYLRIDVGPEAVFGGLQILPIALRPLVGERHPHDRLNVFEAVLPRHRE